jgi:predicted XRE-type DNA-binding protein
MTDSPRFTLGSGNIYADLGFAEPELEQTRAKLARRLADIIKARGLTQIQAADILGLDQPKVSAILRGRLGGLSVERLLRLLTRLDQDVEIVVLPKRSSRPLGHITVSIPTDDQAEALTALSAKTGKTKG